MTMYTTNRGFVLDGYVGWRVPIASWFHKGEPKRIAVEVQDNDGKKDIVVVVSDSIDEASPPVGTRVPHQFLVDPTQNPSILTEMESALLSMLVKACKRELRSRRINHGMPPQKALPTQAKALSPAPPPAQPQGRQREVKKPRLEAETFSLDSGMVNARQFGLGRR